MISVAVCDKPAGHYEFYGYVHYKDNTPIGKKGEPFQFDPAIFMDDDGKLYLYTGFALQGNPILLDGSKPTEHGPMCFELDPSDMLTVKKVLVTLAWQERRSPKELHMKDMHFLRQAPCGNLTEPTILFTVP